MRKGIPTWVVGLLLASIWLFWSFGLIRGSLSFEPANGGQHGKPFEVAAFFGEAFGPIVAFMATVAAISAYQAFNNDKFDKTVQRFGNNFFTLISNLESITSQIYVEVGRVPSDAKFKSTYDPLNSILNREISRSYQGRRALKVILYVLRTRVKPSGYQNIKTVAMAYELIYDQWVANLGHYFRTLYHIYRLIEEQCPANKVYYARIIRAQLSNDELSLLAYNCAVGEGRLKFRRLAERYAIFHNLHRSVAEPYQAAETAFFERKLPAGCFCFEPAKVVTYDD